MSLGDVFFHFLMENKVNSLRVPDDFVFVNA